jgi:hypothetical protein
MEKRGQQIAEKNGFRNFSLSQRFSRDLLLTGMVSSGRWFVTDVSGHHFSSTFSSEDVQSSWKQ